MDTVSSARTARENLAQGLAALQSPGVPPQLMAVADPVAQAMSHLHRIEASGGSATAEAAPTALNFVRQALGMLQAPGVQHPAVDQAMAAIAGSLGVVHQLAQFAPQAPMQAVSPYAGTVMMDQAQLAPPASAAPATRPSQAMPFDPRPEPAPRVAVQNAPAGYGAPPPGYGQPAPQYAPPQQQAQPQGYQQPAPQYAPPPAAAPAHNIGQQTLPAAQSPVAAPPGYAQPGRPGAPRIEAALGAHSPTNFYKGLSGNDVIESGGLFVATYQIWPIGTELVVHVSLPGGYEFESQAVVRWTREAPHSSRGGQEAPPGYGVQFTNISPEGRQLVYRYVRNREPLFHDDF